MSQTKKKLKGVDESNKNGRKHQRGKRVWKGEEKRKIKKGKGKGKGWRGNIQGDPPNHWDP